MKILLIGAALLIVVGGVWYISSNNQQTKVVPEASFPEVSQQASEGSRVIVAGDAGFSPSSLTIKAGEVVTFTNEGSQLVWPASAIHPTHTVYPGSNIAKCSTIEQTGIFDSCKGLTEGEEWSFTFNSVGSWKYHDHLNVSHYGTVVVE